MQQHTKLVTSLRDIRRRDSEARARVPVESREDEVLEKLTMKASDRSVKVKDYRRQNVVVHNGYNELEIGMSCAGDFESVCGLLHDLTTLSRVIHVKKLLMSQSAEGCKVDLGLALFFGAAMPTMEESEEVANRRSSDGLSVNSPEDGRQNQESMLVTWQPAKS